MQRRRFVASSLLLAAPSVLRAQTLEKPRLTIAVGGKNLLYYLPPITACKAREPPAKSAMVTSRPSALK